MLGVVRKSTCCFLVVLWHAFDVSYATFCDKDYHESENCSPCSLYLADKGEGQRIYAGADFSEGEGVGSPDLAFPMFDVNLNHWSPWHEYVRWHNPDGHFHFESRFLSMVLESGLLPNPIMGCAKSNEATIRPDMKYQYRKTPRDDPLVGSQTPIHNFGYKAVNKIRAGQEIHLSCPWADFETSNEEESDPSPGSDVEDLKWLQENGICLDALQVGPSSIQGAGLGAFSRSSVAQGQTIATSPFLHFDRSQVEISEQAYVVNHTLPLKRDHGIEYKASKTRGSQVLLNYCFGHPKSNVLLLPLAPGFTSINHNSKPNAVLRWSSHESTDWWRDASVHLMLREPPAHDMFVELVALREIGPSEEIFIDYGEEWTTALEDHVAKFKGSESEYISADEYLKQNPNKTILTQTEQLSSPYPVNIETACYFSSNKLTVADRVADWSQKGPETVQCPRRCTLVSKHMEDGAISYSALLTRFENKYDFKLCGYLPEQGLLVDGIPLEFVTLVDKPYTSDVHLPWAFRHEIGAPPGFFPESWMAIRQNSSDFASDPLLPGEMEHIRWKETGSIVSPHGYRIGLHQNIRKKLLEYADRIGATDILRHVTKEGNPLESGVETELSLNGDDWYLQRPPHKLACNLQWFSPANKKTHDAYLRALGEAGFDDILDGIGKKLGFEGLVAFQVTFMSMTHSHETYYHTDMIDSDGKAFNIIIPLIAAKETEPELGLMSAFHEEKYGAYKYEDDVAVVIGDDFWHASANSDYRVSKGFRMAATVYVGDINEKNVDSVLPQLTQQYPPGDRDILLSMAGKHWKRDDKNVSLPK